ncbi:MAG: PDZ domain-containing protein, partial [Verrucomicrobiota bacterium]
MKKRLIHCACALLVIFNVAVGVRIYSLQAAGEEKPDAGYMSMAVFARALQLVRQDYVDEKKVGYEQLTHAALRGMLSSLDPHSQFMEASDFKGMQDDTNSRFGGLGVHVAIRDGGLVVVSPMEGSPGFKAGLQPGDQIIKIDGKSTEKMELSDA